MIIFHLFGIVVVGGGGGEVELITMIGVLRQTVGYLVNTISQSLNDLVLVRSRSLLD